MLEETQQNRTKFSSKIYAGILLLLTLIIIPGQQLQRVLQYNKLYNQYTKSLSSGPSQQQNQLQLSHLYPLLSRNPYQGTWQSSIKRSQFLKQQQGKIEIRSIYNQSQDFNNYDIKISIFDGWYRDNPYYALTINSGSIQVKQRYEQQKVLYQTVTPLISYYHEGNGFILGNEKTLYINKLKIKVFVIYYPESKDVKQLRLQILISSQYSINIIGRDIYQYQETFHDVLLAVLLLVQFVIQGYGIYQINQAITVQRQNILRHSKTGFFLLIAFDFCQAIAQTFIGFLSRKKIVVFLLPISLTWIIFIIIQIKFLIKLFHQQFHENSFKFTTKIYILFSLICLLSYFSNFHSWYFIAISMIAMIPQIYNNYMVGHKLKNSMKYFLLYALPRYLLIPYVRFYKYNVFGFEPNWTLCLLCIFVLIGQTALIFVQINYGARAILPKFLHPEQLKYFLSQTDSEDDACSICLGSLKQKSMEQIQMNQLKPTQSQDITNNIVLTPCKHKFHIQCLAASMKSKFQCPNCRNPLPPLEDYE